MTLDDIAPRRIDQPEPGWFTLRLTKGGWAVPCRIARDEASGIWTAEIDGVAKSDADPEAAGVFRIWLYGSPIPEWRYLDLVATRENARALQPDHPSLHPRKRIDPMLMRPAPVPRSILTRKAPADE